MTTDGKMPSIEEKIAPISQDVAPTLLDTDDDQTEVEPTDIILLAQDIPAPTTELGDLSIEHSAE